MAMNLWTIPPGHPFLDALARFWLDGGAVPSQMVGMAGDPLALSRGTIILPTRRAARGLQDAFLRQSQGQALLLPRIVALGALDETPLALAGVLEILPAVDPMRRLSVLSRFVLARGGAFGAPVTIDRAWGLAVELASLLDDAARAGVDLATALPQAAEAEFAEHWRQTLLFLQIVTRAWPDWLHENGLMDVAARQVALLKAQAAYWQAHPPAEPVLAAGAVVGFPAVAQLLRTVAHLPHGHVVLPGLDQQMPSDAWDSLGPGHPQAGLRDLLTAMGAVRADVRAWAEVLPAITPAHRAQGLQRAVLPAPALADWREGPAPALEGLTRLSPADQQEEAVAVALVLRQTLEQPGKRAALVTPDRALAARVAAELLRFGVIVDDSAGEPLAQTPGAGLLRALVRAVDRQLAPVALLGVLKHPFAALRGTPATCRAATRLLEQSALRGPRPGPGLSGLRMAVRHGGRARPGKAEDPPPEVTDLLDRLENALAPLLAWQATPALTLPVAQMLVALVQAAEAVAATQDQPGAARLWRFEDGSALADLLARVMEAVADLPPQPPSVLPGFLDAILEGQAVRGRRAVRGRVGENGQPMAEHPRVFIWGLLEARLQHADTLVLGGLAEGVWPPATDPGPWMSRPMRTAVGLPSLEDRIGQMAHDFVMSACAAPQAVLSCPRRRDGAPAVPARWLTRLDAFLEGYGQALPRHPAAHWARAMDRPAGAVHPVRPPAPRPPVAQRPRRLSVTEIETWLRDPYAIYARHILRLRALDPLEQPTDAADYGSIVHQGIAILLHELGAEWPKDAPARLRSAMLTALRQASLRPALASWWRPRVLRIAEWIAHEETRRRAEHPVRQMGAEVSGAWHLHAPAGPFLLRGRADRIERRTDGTVAIIDYKTGTPPSQKEVAAGLAPQLPLEAAMVAAGAFGETLAGEVMELTYWHLSGGFEPGKVVRLFGDKPGTLPEIIQTAHDKLHALMADFDRPERAYLSRPHPGAAPRFSDYAQLARVAEWAMAGE